MSLRQGQSIRKTDMNVKMSIYLLGWKRIKKIKKLLTKPIIYDNINKLSLRQQQRTLKTEQYVKP
ncbi:hypothetical protein DWX76_13080 [Clostridium sp. AF21-20LB]|nr:hypothetical protein DWX76_13080 [Clostridium sp. AF21-20LB]